MRSPRSLFRPIFILASRTSLARRWTGYLAVGGSLVLAILIACSSEEPGSENGNDEFSDTPQVVSQPGPHSCDGQWTWSVQGKARYFLEIQNGQLVSIKSADRNVKSLDRVREARVTQPQPNLPLITVYADASAQDLASAKGKNVRTRVMFDFEDQPQEADCSTANEIPGVMLEETLTDDSDDFPTPPNAILRGVMRRRS